MSPFKAISFLSLHASFPSLFDLVEKKKPPGVMPGGFLASAASAALP
jgi:hypothetical protein